MARDEAAVEVTQQTDADLASSLPEWTLGALANRFWAREHLAMNGPVRVELGYEAKDKSELADAFGVPVRDECDTTKIVFPHAMWARSMRSADPTLHENLSRLGLEALDVRALGFSDQSSFTRAFKRWHGQTPAAWRAQH